MNTIINWYQLVLFLGLLLMLTPVVGNLLYDVLDATNKTPFTRLLGWLEKGLYKMGGINHEKEQNWKEYSVSLLIFSVVTFLFTYFILRWQNYLPLNANKLGSVSSHLAFNTASSFTANTNWQSYGGESTLSHFSQMVGLTFQNFASAAVGIAVAGGLVRGMVRHTAETIGNFWVDLVRITLYLLLPLALILAIFFLSQGVIQNFNKNLEYKGLDNTGNNIKVLPGGPVASQEAIKLLGTNGGGFFNANSAHPYENPTPLTNFVQMLAIFLIPSGLTYYLGRMSKNKKHGWAVWLVMTIFFLAAFLICWQAEERGNTHLRAVGIYNQGNMEGKEVRFGIFNSALFATVTTDASCGAVNAMLDSFTPVGGLIPLVNIQLGEIVFGGVGSGLYGMLIYIILAVFLAGLMVGRTPEYLGKKIEALDIKLCVFCILVIAVLILCPTAWAVISKWGKDAVNVHNKGIHGFSELLYAFSSGAGNNGSAFAGLATNSPAFNIILGLIMLAGRFLVIIPILALAGNFARKKLIPISNSSFPVTGLTFIFILLGTILIIGLLTFFPALSLGPLCEAFITQ